MINYSKIKESILGVRSLSEKGVSSKQALSFLVAVSCAAPVINFQLSYICLSLLYVLYAWDRYQVQRDFSVSLKTFWFFCAVGVTVAIWIIHRDTWELDGDFFRTLELAGFIGVFVLVADMSEYLVRRRMLNALLIAKSAIVLLLIFTVLKAVFLVASSEVASFAGLFRLQGQRNMLIPLNPNHMDNIAYFLVALVFWAYLVIWFNNAISKVMFFFAAPLCVLFAVLYATTETLGGFAGFGAGLLFVAALFLMRFLTVKRIVLLLPALLVIAFGFFTILKDREMPKPIAQSVVFLNASAFANMKEQACTKYTEFGRPEFSGDLAIMPTITYRVALAVNAIQIWKDAPVVGHGGYNRTKFASEIEGTDDCILGYFYHTHNLYLDILIRGGLLLLLVYIFFAACVLWSVVEAFIRTNSSYEKLLLAPFAIYVVYAIVENLSDLSLTSSDALIAVALNLSMLWMISKAAMDVSVSEEQLIEQ